MILSLRVIRCEPFYRKPVDADTLAAVFSVAQCAPSNCNTQPWVVHVVSGDKLEVLRSEMPERFMAGGFSMDFPYDGTYEGVYKERQYGAAQALYDAVNITRKDKEARNSQFMRNFTFFDAPHVAFLFLPEPFGLREAADLGMYAQTLMLTLTAHGLGSCPQTALSFQADLYVNSWGSMPAISWYSACLLATRIPRHRSMPVSLIALLSQTL